MSSSESAEFIDYYELLGIRHTAEMHEIRRAYIVKAKLHHPDAGGSIEMMQRLNTAYKTLKSSTGKAAYDMLHGFHTGSTSPGDYHYSDGRQVNGVTDMADDEIDAFLNNLLAEYRDGPPAEKHGLGHWLKTYLKKI